MTIADIKKAYIKLLKSEYRNIKIYGIEIKEGFDKPAFFIDMSPVTMGTGDRNRYNTINVYTTYFQKEVDEIDIYDKVDGIRDLIGNKLTVGDRSINITDYDYTMIGKDRNILKISFTLSYYDLPSKRSDDDNQRYDVMNKFYINRG